MDKIQSIIKELMDAALMGEGDHQAAPVCCADIYNGLVDLESALHSVEAEKEPEWISCDERLPEIHDGDVRGFVWVYGDSHGRLSADLMQPHQVSIDAGDTHWMPTGLHRPAPPEHKPE